MRRASLKLRVAWAFAWFGGILSIVLAAVIYWSAHDLGQRLIDETLKAEMEDYIARRQRNPASLPPSTVTLRGYVLPPGSGTDSLPEPLRTLSPGLHEIQLEDTVYRLAVSDAQGTRYFMAFNESRHRERERHFMAYLAAAALLMALISAGGGLWMAGRLIAPVTLLARQVADASPQAHPELGDSADEALDEVGELRKTFDSYLGRLHAFVNRERAFTADVSHELRTPIAVIQGSIEVLLEDPRLTEGQRERLTRMAQVAEDMGELVRALLLMAREEHDDGRLDADCDVAAVVRDCVERHRHLARPGKTEVHLELPAAPHLPTEGNLLSIIVGNLVRNAFAHAEAGQVSIRLEEDRLEVRDTGIGIRTEDIGRVFQRYYKGASSQGEGIGLSLARRICERYGWQIRIESSEGQGTLVTLHFSAGGQAGAPNPPITPP